MKSSLLIGAIVALTIAQSALADTVPASPKNTVDECSAKCSGNTCEKSSDRQVMPDKGQVIWEGTGVDFTPKDIVKGGGGNDI